MIDKDKDIGLQRQEGGDHYRRFKIQPVEFIIANQLGFLAGNIVKYATRYKFKGGAEDVRKIIHYCELILEFEYSDSERAADELAKPEHQYYAPYQMIPSNEE
jgi:hypothetical protein